MSYIQQSEDEIKEQLFGVKSNVSGQVPNVNVPNTPVELARAKMQLLNTISFTNRAIMDALSKLEECVAIARETQAQVKMMELSLESIMNQKQ
ncbi:MAG TPA: hypothetical protein ENO30_04305 [Thermodesulfobium narugense]|nr:hypothetical protein [Thermodesulfobium narugense]